MTARVFHLCFVMLGRLTVVCHGHARLRLMLEQYLNVWSLFEYSFTFHT